MGWGECRLVCPLAQLATYLVIVYGLLRYLLILASKSWCDVTCGSGEVWRWKRVFFSLYAPACPQTENPEDDSDKSLCKNRESARVTLKNDHGP